MIDTIIMNPQQQLIQHTLSDQDTGVYIVGGYVRDRILDIKPSDHDYVVVGVTIEQMLQFGFTQVGKSFPVFLAPNGDEFALARSTVDNTVPSLRDDLYRRDITINALARVVIDFNDDGHGTLSDDIIDYFGGVTDLRHRTIRHISPYFADDPARVLRVARFAARYEFTIDPSTIDIMKMIVDSRQLYSVSTERVWNEFSSALLTNQPYHFFETLERVGAFSELFPSLSAHQIMHTSISLANLAPTLSLRFTFLLVTSNYVGICSFCDRLKVPPSLGRLAARTQYVYQTSNTHATLTPELVMEILYNIDAFRQPDQVFTTMSIILIFLSRHTWISTLAQCLTAGLAVKRDTLPREEDRLLVGKALGTRIIETRYQRIADTIEVINTDKQLRLKW